MLSRNERARCITVCATLALSCMILPVAANDTPVDTGQVADLSLEQLLDIEVTSVSKKPEKMAGASAAVYVITREDIRRASVLSVPELLRMVPGVNVAQIDSNKWAISIRGFNELYSNKLLVLVDGRSVYSPVFSGVHWDVQDLPLNSIERIEVIRGPGATLWGANAVNGVIYIITKHSTNTQGIQAELISGTHERVNANVSIGGKWAKKYYTRLYGQYTDRGAFETEEGDNGHDDWSVKRTGIRIDADQTNVDKIMFAVNYHEGDIGSINSIPQVASFTTTVESEDELRVEGKDVLVRWTHTVSQDSEYSLQVYFDDLQREDDVFEEDIKTTDIEFQHRFPLAEQHEIIWGIGYRYIKDKTQGTTAYSLLPAAHTSELTNLFIQDNFTLFENTTITIGSKFEHTKYTETEVQPNLRVAHAMNDDTTVWAAVSRASRTPSRNDLHARITAAAFPMGFGTFGTSEVHGSEAMESEKLTAYEIGMRTHLASHISVDLAVFYNEYSDLRDTQSSQQSSGSLIQFIETFNNQASAYTSGAEVFGHWRVRTNWLLSGGASYLDVDIKSASDFTQASEHNTPHWQLNLKSQYDVTKNLEFDSYAFYVGKIKQPVGQATETTDSYTRVDMRLNWMMSDAMSVFGAVLNTFDGKHRESASFPFTVGTEIERSVYVGVKWSM